MPALLQEIVSVYPLLSPPNLTAHVSNRVCNALALLQCVASHPETRQLFLNAHIPLFLYPFLNTTSKTRPFEYLRLTSLGVIGALVKDVAKRQYHRHPLPALHRDHPSLSPDHGNRIRRLSKTVAIFIVQKILLDETGLTYICHTYERFYAVGTVLSNMVNQLVETQAVRLLKHVVRCYLRLSDNLRAREALRACLPEPLRDNTFNALLKVLSHVSFHVYAVVSRLRLAGGHGDQEVLDDLAQQLERAVTLYIHDHVDDLYPGCLYFCSVLVSSWADHRPCSPSTDARHRAYGGVPVGGAGRRDSEGLTLSQPYTIIVRSGPNAL
ncbi:hypothetical protein NUW54_g13453 [Trametes sanguinea]|uniref:Uncharacterized protein n=1 Tax=Trametes sanguinea TaxID=158606 RepID=A0ACC1MMY7_9APHY|nr:hypothetical protein NUW54_g13453 [Trametes sanguinea]